MPSEPSTKKAPAKKAPAKKAPAKKAPAKKAPGGVGLGQRAPGFRLADQTGAVVDSKQLRGQPYILYFYPKDSTPGCTQEACDFRDSMAALVKASVRVLGVSPDAIKSHQRFAERYDLPFSLLADPDHELALAYGAWTLKSNYGRQYMGIERSTFLIDARGVIQREWRRVKVRGHVSAVIEAAACL